MAEMGKPLRLKDLLELDCDSCSAAGFRCYPRRLGDSSSSPMSLSFCRSPSSFRRPSKLSHISRSLSRRLRESFRWRRNDEVEVADTAVRGCGSEPDTSPSDSSDSSGTTRRGSRSGSDSEFSTASSSSASEIIHTSTAGDEHEDGRKKREEGSSSGSEADDKEQLSPVAVMDFPCFDDDAAGSCSPSLDDGLLSRVQAGGRKKMHRIRRFGSLEGLVPVDLEARLAAASADAGDHDHVPVAQQLTCHAEETTPRGPSSSVHDLPDASCLPALLMDTVLARTDAVSEQLLLDFFAEMKVVERRLQHHSVARKAGRLGDGAKILAAARGWLLDGAGWGLEDVLRGGETVVAEMERGRLWMQVGEEEREVGVVVAGVLTDQLVDEVVRDLLV